jgi:hypothetical protein
MDASTVIGLLITCAAIHTLELLRMLAQECMHSAVMGVKEIEKRTVYLSASLDLAVNNPFVEHCCVNT